MLMNVLTMSYGHHEGRNCVYPAPGFMLGGIHIADTGSDTPIPQPPLQTPRAFRGSYDTGFVNLLSSVPHTICPSLNVPCFLRPQDLCTSASFCLMLSFSTSLSLSRLTRL